MYFALRYDFQDISWCVYFHKTETPRLCLSGGWHNPAKTKHGLLFPKNSKNVYSKQRLEKKSVKK
jgi:hypothetical protein